MSDSALPPNDKEMSLVQHLLELRNSMTRAILAILVMFVILFPFANDLYIYISEPLNRFLPEGTGMIATGVASPFLTPFKLSLVLAIYLAMPYLLFQLWSFIAPALYSHEKKLIGPILFFSSFLFYAGGAFAFYVVFPLLFGFLSTTAPDGVTIATDIALYLDFVIKMFFAFGLAFEVPIVVVLLILTGMASPKKLSHSRPYVIVGAFVIGMLLTPPDIISQTLLAVPMWILYEAGIIVGAWVLKNRKSTKENAEKPEEEQRQENFAAAETAHSENQSEQKTSANGLDKEDKLQGYAEHEFDTRYANLGDDDDDEEYWDNKFDQIDSEFQALEKEHKQRKADEKKSSDQTDGNDSDPSDSEPAKNVKDKPSDS